MTPTELRKYRYTRVLLSIDHAKERLNFIQESAPLANPIGTTFSRLGFAGLNHTICDMIEDLARARKILKKLSKEPINTM